ncbi:MAG TPA: 3-deoxy-7-phosphoheptulonate synthase [Gammaproteobacteria bacterium]|nr:3-deoxy-7-phosphoheptulonate synthase [Gammaproteobacteria bacterium]
MLLLLKPDITPVEIEHLTRRLAWMGLQAVPSHDEGRYALAVVHGENNQVRAEQFKSLPGIEAVLPFAQKYKLVSSTAKKQRTLIRIGDKIIGAENQVTVMAGPCSIESFEQIETTAAEVARAGGAVLRGGAFKPRTSPYEFQGLGEQGLQYMQAAARKHNLLTITEVMSLEQIDLVASYIDILQIGARNMQNFNLLKAVAKAGKPVLLKRGQAATYNEFLLAAEYILSAGNAQVMLCERGIRTFENYTRNTLDIAAVPVLQALSHLPVIIDPSHGVGIRQFVPALARAAVAAGADGVIIEIHPDPDKALSDGPQSLTLPQFTEMMQTLRKVAQAVDKQIVK